MSILRPRSTAISGPLPDAVSTLSSFASNQETYPTQNALTRSDSLFSRSDYSAANDSQSTGYSVYNPADETMETCLPYSVTGDSGQTTRMPDYYANNFEGFKTDRRGLYAPLEESTVQPEPTSSGKRGREIDQGDKTFDPNRAVWPQSERPAPLPLKRPKFTTVRSASKDAGAEYDTPMQDV